MYRTRGRRSDSGRTRKILIGVGALALVGGAVAIGTGVSSAAETNPVCAGLDTAIQRNLDFMADQQAHPTAQTAGILVNRQQVIDQINVQKKASGCTEAGPIAGGVTSPVTTSPTSPATKAPAGNAGSGSTGSGSTGSGSTGANTGNAGGSGDVVCKGSTVTLSGTGGAPAASSGTFPIGTKLKVTNLDNNKSTTVSVTEVSGSCVLLNNAAFEQVRESGKFLIRHAVIEKVG